jgi:hypothetical protein
MNVRNETGRSSSSASTAARGRAVGRAGIHNRDETGSERVRSYSVETKREADAEPIRTACCWPSTCSTSRRPRGPSSAGGTKIDAWRLPALTFQIVPNVVVGVDLWYLRHCQGVAFHSFTGDAVYPGPTFFWRIAPKVLMSAA